MAKIKAELLIDNALFGLRLSYDLSDDWKVKVFTGQQKKQFDLYPAIIIGGNIEGFSAASIIYFEKEIWEEYQQAGFNKHIKFQLQIIHCRCVT